MEGCTFCTGQAGHFVKVDSPQSRVWKMYLCWYCADLLQEIWPDDVYIADRTVGRDFRSRRHAERAAVYTIERLIAESEKK